jgi:hypothetical protein
MEIMFFHDSFIVPKYLKANLLSFRRKFPNEKLTLICNRNNYIRFANRNNINFEKADFHNLEYINLLETIPDEYSLVRYAIGRFLFIEKSLQSTNTSVLLFESDIWISQEFPFAKFKNLENLEFEMAFSLLAEGQGIGSIVWFKNLKSISNFNNFMLKKLKANSSLTDMDLLWMYFEANYKKIFILPSGDSDCDMFTTNTTKIIQRLISRGSSYFGGVFDPATLGQFYTGENPGNLLGIRRLFHKLVHHYIDPSKVRIEFNGFESAKVICANFKISLYSLHIHSKQPELFGKRNDIALMKKFIKYNQKEKLEFDFFAGIRQIRIESIFNFLRFLKEKASKN